MKEYTYKLTGMQKYNLLNRFRRSIERKGSFNTDEKMPWIGLIFHPNKGLSQPPSSWAENTYIFGRTPSLYYRNSIPRFNLDLTVNIKYLRKNKYKKTIDAFLEQ